MEFHNLKRYSDLDKASEEKQIVGLLIKGKGKYIASTYIRLLAAFDNFKNDSFEFYIIDDLEVDRFIKDLQNENLMLDIVIAQRDVIDMSVSKLLVEKCNLYGIKLIYEIDDDLVNIDTTQPDFKRYEEKINVVRYLAENAACITVTTDSLKASLSGFNNNIEILPNVLTDSWNLDEDYEINDGDTIKIGYMGTTTHANDLKLIEEAIKNIQESSSKNIVFEMVGGTDSSFEGMSRVNVPFDKRHYPDFVEWLQNAIRWDIAIAPLVENNNINQSKSELKYLEYTALNVPGIYSDVGPYAKCISHGDNGLLVKNNSVEEWEINMKRLIESKELREKILKNSREDIFKNYVLENMTNNWEILLNNFKRDKNSVLYQKVKEYNNIDENISFNKFLLDTSKDIIEGSGLFDEEYYLSKYPDVKESEFSPIDHYLTLGADEYCNPSDAFNTKEYVNRHPFVDKFNMNPLVHYILYGNIDVKYPIIHATDKAKNIEILKKSDLFDPDLYLEMYPDVKNAGMDPYLHYATYGYKENYRRPFPNFSNSFYKNAYLDNSNSWNPLTHYILIGENNGYNINSWGVTDNYYEGSVVDSIINKLNQKVSIFIPIFNYSPEVIDSIKLILRNTHENFEFNFFIFNDLVGNYDGFFKQISKSHDLNLITFEKDNFIYMIKETVSSCLNDAVLINSYTKVPDNWLTRLITKAYSKKEIDVVSPISNLLTGIIPFDKSKSDNEYNLTIEGISTLLKKSSNFNDLPSNICEPFCIYIKNEAIDNLKSFSEKQIVFDSENELAFIELPKNINHVIDDSVYVYHMHRSFLDDSNLFSDYGNEFSSKLNAKKFLGSPSIKNIKERFDSALVDKRDVTLSNRVLYVVDEKKVHLLADFLNYYNLKHYDCYFLTSARNTFKLWKDGEVILSWEDINISFNNQFRCEALREIYFNVLSNLNINIIHIDDLKLNSFDLMDVGKLLNCSFVIDGSIDRDDCFNEQSYLIDNGVDFKESHENWNSSFSQLLKLSTVIYPNGESSEGYEKSDESSVAIKTPIFDDKLVDIFDENRSDKIKLLIPEELSDSENDLIRDIKEKDTSDMLKIHFLDSLQDNIGDKIKDIAPDFAVLLNPFPEMFEIIDSCNSNRIPIIVDENSLDDFIEELEFSNYTNFKDSSEVYDYILDLFKPDNYYSLLKSLYYSDIGLKKEIIKYDNDLDVVYLGLGNNNPKMFLEEVHLSDMGQNKAVPFSDFEGFLANSYVSPILYAPFVEEEKRCFAVMDNIAKYLMSNVKDDSKLVSIIMPVYNRVDIVEKAIDSVLNQTYTNFELVIVDDGSSDGTRDLLEDIDDDRIKLIFNESNVGASAARNVALDECSGEYIFYLDSDNEWDSKYLEAMVGAFIELPDANAIYSGQLLYDNIGHPPFAMRFGSLNKSLLKNGNYIDLNCFAHTKRVYDEIGGFDESLYRLVDWDLILRICNNFKVYSVPILLSKYYMSVTDNSISDANARSNEKMLGYKNLTRVIQNDNDFNIDIDYKLDKKVNVIIPSFESLKDLRECINAIRKFDNDKVKIIIVDNNSGKAVRYYLETLKSKGIIELIQNDINYGFTYAVNQGIEISDDDADILLLNNDAILMDNSIEAMQKFAYEHDDCAIVVPQQVLPGGTPTMKQHVPYASEGFDCDVNPSAHHKNIVNMDNFHDGESLELSFAPFFCTYIKREVLDKSFGLDAELGRHYRSDRIFSGYVRHVMNYKIFHVTDAIVYHKLQKSTQSLKKNEESYDNMLFKNKWEDDLAEELGFKCPEWDLE
ncbi:glycosyltransferase [Methanobrevibacter sp.]|uniref:glycosyltransferase n=1 Tax=Methanobrevibacter sp. TaxID=66852 RepID=UPI0025F5A75E|nr:glycosyltransferase [Methanobrevibacter sp.]MBQ2832688.1 glycosyltransferase [Methanobrevibacter sp.]